MSYQYGQYPENFSNPTTPLDAYPMPTWETLQHDAQQQAQSLQDNQQQHHSEVTSLTGAPPHTSQYRLTQLDTDEHPLTVPSQPCDDDGILLRQPYSVTSEIQRRSLRESSPGLHVEITRGSSSASGPGPDRPTRSNPRSHTAPYHTGRYRDPASANNAPHTRKQRKPTVRLGHNSLPSSSMPSPAIPSPAAPSPAPRIVSFGSSAVGSPSITPDVPSVMRSRPERTAAVLPETPAEPTPRLTLRTDTHYDPEAQLVTVVLELPGVKKTDVSVALSTCTYNRVKQITVSGRSYPLFPSVSTSHANRPLIIRERKYGAFSRTFAVPAETRREDIDASMEDGVLIIRVPCGPPALSNPEDVPIR